MGSPRSGPTHLSQSPVSMSRFLISSSTAWSGLSAWECAMPEDWARREKDNDCKGVLGGHPPLGVTLGDISDPAPRHATLYLNPRVLLRTWGVCCFAVP